LQSANAIWTQNSLPLVPAFVSAMARYYRSGVWQVDFAGHSDAASAAINAWTSRMTHGRIRHLFDPGQLDSSTRLVLADAVYLLARWQQPFDPEVTERGLFTLESGGTTTARFMRSSGGDVAAPVGAGYQAVQLPYVGGRFAALAVMPTSGTLASFVAALTASRLRSIVTALRPDNQVTVELPRFTATSDLDLGAALKALGMTSAFGSSADFSGLSPVPLWVQAAEQRAYLRVGEKGTEAAAVSGIAIGSSGIAFWGATFRFDHPFVFLVRDTVTGTVLFASEVQNPAG
jgi:serpin B